MLSLQKRRGTRRPVAFAFLVTIAPLVLHVACSASNGDVIPGEVRDAGSIDAGNNNNGNGTNEDGSSSEDSGKTKDGSPDIKDATADAKEGSTPAPIVIINEIYVDHDGLGDGPEFVELLTEPGARIDDLKLRLLGSDGQVKYVATVAPPNTTATTGLWVVSGGQTFKLVIQSKDDQVIPLGSWGLDNARGAVQLVRGTELLDVVGWSKDSDAGALTSPSTAPFATGEGSPSPIPTIAKHSFGRKQGAADTNNNFADFCSMIASPGYAQKACD